MWLLGQFIVLMACVFFVGYSYKLYFLPDIQAKVSFQQINCFMISKKLTTHGHAAYQYRPDFLISYHVKGVQYNRWVSNNGLDMSFSRHRKATESQLQQFTVGKTYTCWYHPLNPSVAILIPRHHWLSDFFLMFPAVIFVMTLYFFIRNVLRLTQRHKAQAGTQIKKKKK
ncbi:MAG: hypothetical protein A3E85_06130 [Gammaproteobacteria bacterium RIFCSPHIGHO2_12_FULL_45_12]|nr:MAG: hypothetical protein A3E85_06130 [Gammaproteobacteria bacterium RIFCSPHIGHO2_12_FULL_45_12]